MTSRPIGADDRNRVLAELARLCETDGFARAPIMRQLLKYLVERTLAGEGALLKAYTVAVDGLGRSDRFDPQTDSYPRVQVGRLRRLLDSAYAQEPNVELELRVAPVGYSVELHERKYCDALCNFCSEDSRQAQPDRPSPGALQTDQFADRTTGAAAPKPEASSPFAGLPAILFAALVMLPLLAAWAIWSSRNTPVRQTQMTEPPVLVLDVPNAGEDEDARRLKGWLTDALRRSWLYELRVEGTDPADEQDIGNKRPTYRLTVDRMGTDPKQFAFRLTYAPSGAVRWSAVVTGDIPTMGEQSPYDVIVAKISGPRGIVSDSEFERLRPYAVLGYGCEVRASHFLEAYPKRERARVTQCVDESLKFDPENSRLLLIKSLLLFNRTDPRLRLSPRKVAQSAALVRAAIESDPGNPEVMMLGARLEFLRGNCIRGRERALQAIDAWPYNPGFWAPLSAYLFDCNAPDAVDFARNALRLDPGDSSMPWAVIALDALERQDLAAANRAVTQMNLAGLESDIYADLAQAAVAAANGNHAEAERRWSRLADRARLQPDTREAVYRQLHIGPHMRRVVEAQLARSH